MCSTCNSYTHDSFICNATHSYMLQRAWQQQRQEQRELLVQRSQTFIKRWMNVWMRHTHVNVSHARECVTHLHTSHVKASRANESHLNESHVNKSCRVYMREHEHRQLLVQRSQTFIKRWMHICMRHAQVNAFCVKTNHVIYTCFSVSGAGCSSNAARLWSKVEWTYDCVTHIRVTRECVTRQYVKCECVAHKCITRKCVKRKCVTR